jgi:tetratricopeptide (TPR) repeat protein
MRLPLPEVVNNQGVAASRRGKDAAALFQQAITADPRDPDYHFNLAVALTHRNDTAGALKEVEETLKLRPQDAEAQALEKQLQDPAAAQPNPDPGHAITDEQGPLERIKRGYSEAGFRQAAFELEQVQQMRLASMPPNLRAAALVKDGDQFFQRGLVLEAEREYREALAADGSSALAHAGLAAVRERDADPEAARKEAQASIALKPNVPAYLVLARLDLQANALSAAAGDVGEALKVDPGNANAKGMKMALERRGAP